MSDEHFRDAAKVVDSREKLEEEMAEYLEREWYMLAPGLLEKMGGWLDRQAAITAAECRKSEQLRAGVVKDAAECGDVLNVFGVPYVPKAKADELREKLSMAIGYANEILWLQDLGCDA